MNPQALYQELGMHAGHSWHQDPPPSPQVLVERPARPGRIPRLSHTPQSIESKRRIAAAHVAAGRTAEGKPRVDRRAMPGTVKAVLVRLANGEIQYINARNKNERNKYYSIAKRMGLRITSNCGIITVIK